MYEVELKAHLTGEQYWDIKKRLQNEFHCQFGKYEYHDTYFDTENHDLAAAGKELRLRKIKEDKSERILLTSKEPPFDEITRSKMEHEIEVDDYDEAQALLTNLGFVEDIAFKKYCSNCSIEYNYYQVNISLVEIDELPDRYIELEILVGDEEQINPSMNTLQELITILKINPEQLTNEYYTDLVRSITSQYKPG